MKVLEPKSAEPKKKVAIGAAGASVIFHVTLFLLVGSVVVVEYAVPHATMIGEVTPVVSEESVTPEETPEAMGEPEAPEAPSEAAAAAPSQSTTELSVSSVDVITSAAPSPSFSMPVAMSGGSGTVGTEAGGSPSGTGGKSGKPGKISNPFGGDTSLGNASLEGVLYDLKQSRNGKPSGMTPDKYITFLQEFFRKDWSENLLNDFYRVKKPLFTSQIYMPLMAAGAAPAAFHVEKEVQPAQWVIIYRGSFQVPQGGSFRLAGYADDVLVVRINGKTVLDGSRMKIGADKKPEGLNFTKTAGLDVKMEHKVGNGWMIYSDWLRFESGQNNTVEILVGERPGGQFCAYLFVEERGKNYKKEASGRPILPLFRTADMETTQDKTAAFDTDGPVFGIP